MFQKLQTICLTWLASLLFTASVMANTQTDYDALFGALDRKAWNEARSIAKNIDAQNARGDIILAFADSVEALNTGNCKAAKQLSTLVIDNSPGFLPAYDILAQCLISEGSNQQAAELYQNLANELRDGSEKDIAQQKADRLRPDLTPRYVLDFSIIPSSNTSRRTERASIGNGGVLTAESRAQEGLSVSGSVQLIKPIFKSKRLLSQVSLKLGGRYDTIREKVSPLVGIETRNTWLLSNTKSVYAAPFYEYTWTSGERFLDEYGIRFGSYTALDATKQLSTDFIISNRDFSDPGRDSTFLFGSITNTLLLNESNRIKFTASAFDIDADNRFFNVSDYSLNVELETAHQNGLITSVGGVVGTRRYDRNATLSTEEREDTYYSASFGVSHQSFVFNQIRPELVYTYTNQSSNDVLDDFSAHDIGLKLKAAF